jgi:hypothetical protein
MGWRVPKDDGDRLPLCRIAGGNLSGMRHDCEDLLQTHLSDFVEVICHRDPQCLHREGISLVPFRFDIREAVRCLRLTSGREADSRRAIACTVASLHKVKRDAYSPGARKLCSTKP